MTKLPIKNRSVFVIDGTNIMHRHYFVKKDLKASDGTPTGALYGTINMLKSYIEQYKPYQIYVCFDKHRRCFRNELYPEYKGNRPPTNTDLKVQYPLLKKFCQLANIPFIDKDNYEADDLIGSLCTKAFDYGFTPYVISGDKDVFQLIDKNIDIIYLTNNGPVLYDASKLSEKYNGLRPDQFIEFKALKGDSGDNVPGVPKVGDKTAIDLLLKYNTIDGIYENIELIKGKLKDNLVNNKDVAYLAKKLVTIKCDIELNYNDYFEMQFESNFDNDELKCFLENLDIKKF